MNFIMYAAYSVPLATQKNNNMAQKMILVYINYRQFIDTTKKGEAS